MTIREGKWDCTTCGRKGNRGPDSYCGSCGATRPDDVKFYLPEDAAEVTDEKLIAEAESGADWSCSYCSTQNNAFDNFCVSCGNGRDLSQGDKSLEQREIRFDDTVKDETAEVKPAAKPVWKKVLTGVVSIAAVVIILFLLSFIKTEIDLTVTGFEYQASVTYEEYKLVTEEDWQIPAGGNRKAEFRAIHHYDKVPDGTVTKTRDVSVKVGEKRVKVGTKDLGNGYFKDIYENRPVYETRKETYTETVYRDVPVYRTKYRYTIMKWVPGAPFNFSGRSKETVFASKEDELRKFPERYRNVKSSAMYYIDVKNTKGEDLRDDVKYKTWLQVKMNDRIKGEKSTVFGFFYGIKE